MRFHSYDGLAIFAVAARHLSFTAAAAELNMTKGAISYRIRRLEEDLGFPLFVRQHRGLALTENGRQLWQSAQAAFREVEQRIDQLRAPAPGRITVGMSTYFASRWLSPRLMRFMATHPGIGLRLQPLVDLIDIKPAGIDMAIRWGKGNWTDLTIEPLFPCPVFPTAGGALANHIARAGFDAALPDLTLLHDRDGSTAWRDWFAAAGLRYAEAPADGLVIPDPNVRVQAVIDGQGVALNDALLGPDLSEGRLARVSGVELVEYGYHLAYPPGALEVPALAAFRDWILDEARGDPTALGQDV